MKKLTKNEWGFSPIEAILLLVIVIVIVGVGYYVYRVKKNTTSTYNTSANASTTTKPVVKSKPSTTASSNTATAKTNSSTTTTKTQTGSTSSQTSSTPPTTTTPSPPSPSVAVSSDGCYVTATGTPGWELNLYVYQGVDSSTPTYVIRDSGSITVSTGGKKGYTVDATLVNFDSNLQAHDAGTVTSNSCPSATTPPG